MKTITDITPIQQKKNEKTRLAAYCRVSSDSQDQLHSYATQIRYYKGYADAHPEYELVDIYTDEGITGTEMEKRDELMRLIKDCKKGSVDRIIVKSVSRFARNTEDFLITTRMLKDIGVSVYFEEQGIDTNKLNAEMFVTFPGMIAQQESMTISGNLRWGYQKRMKAGDFICTYPPYGYRFADKKMVIKEDEAKIVRRIFDMYLSGNGIQTITNIFNEEKVPHRYENRKWSHTTIRYILKNERYKGSAILQKRYTTTTLPFRRKINDGEYPKYYVENSNPAIIDAESFDKVQTILAKKRVESQGKKCGLHGKIRCPHCGSLYRLQRTGDKIFWLCSKTASGGLKCPSLRVREDMVQDAFIKMSYKLKRHRVELIEKTLLRLQKMQGVANRTNERIKEIDKTIADLSAKNLVVTRLHTSGVLDAAEYAEQNSEINRKLMELRAERQKLFVESEDRAVVELSDVNDAIDGYQPKGVFDEEFFENIVERIAVNDNENITFYLYGGLKFREIIKENGRSKV